MFPIRKPKDDITIAYRKKHYSYEVAETEMIWRLINFTTCANQTNAIRKAMWLPIQNMSRYCSYIDAYQEHGQPFDRDFRLLSKLLKCITFVQDMNQCTKMSEILGDKTKYVVNEALGKPIFTGSSEEGLAIFGNEALKEDENYDELNCKTLHDIDIMYESDKMAAFEIDSWLHPIDLSGVVLMRPGKKAGYVTLQKFLPKSVIMEMKNCSMVKTAKVYPKPEEYIGQEIFMQYIPALAFLVASENDLLPQDCSCVSFDGHDKNRYGDLCYDCRLLTLREIPRGEGISPTKIWSDTIRITGPAIHENAFIENISDPLESSAPLNEVELKQKAELYERRSRDEELPTVLPTVKPALDLFSSYGRKMFYIDHVPAVKCVNWPSAAWEFTVRERPSGWPPKHVIQEIVANGCHIVPRSTKPPPETKLRQAYYGALNTLDYIDWRLSFSQAENILASTLNTAQVKCLVLLKILNDIITDNLRPFRKEEDYEMFYAKPFYLDSYLLKSTFFWVCEEIPLEEWQDDNLGACLFKVVEKLILFLQKGTIPNYFIPSSNLIEAKSEINPCMTNKDAHELSFKLKMFRAKTSNEIFEILHKRVWNDLWEDSEIKPPGSTPQDLTMVMEALKEENQERWEELQRERHREKEGQASTHATTEDAVPSCSKNDAGDDQISTTDHNYGTNDANTSTFTNHSASNGSKRRISTEVIQASCEAADEQCSKRVCLSDVIQKMPKSDLVFAQIFAAISKFLYTNGNIHGKGFNTARAAFYEEEAKKLLPEGCSLDDLPEYKLPDTSPSPSDSPDSSDYECEEEDEI